MDSLCSVCEAEPAVGVACVPGVPFSASYGRRCLIAGAHPWGILVANTACLGGWDRAADWWKEIVLTTCRHLDRSVEEFKKAVTSSIEELEKGPDPR